eukprot:TRINITY_DN19308_c0_g1_i1.p1 TRINITY_DN19308_c0_g1~~TRINITY_DN19308_c0_g1_i1.p1  ORF type:complete len:165 (+),score=39.91 TRINITY_DN19308_c0_g1_i1:50-496(+)
MDGAPYTVESSKIPERNITQKKGDTRPLVAAVGAKGLEARRVRGTLERINMANVAAGFDRNQQVVGLPVGKVKGLGNGFSNPDTTVKKYDKSIPKSMVVHSSMTAPQHKYIPIERSRVADWTPPSIPGGYSKHARYSRHYHIQRHRHH